MYKGFAVVAGAVLAALLWAMPASAQDYAVPVTIAGRTYTLTVSVESSTVKVTSSTAGVKIGTVQQIAGENAVVGTSSAQVAQPGAPAANRDANLRSGPGTSFAIVGSVDTGQSLAIVARNQDGTWFQLESGAWIAGFLVSSAPAKEDLPLADDIPEAAPAAAQTASEGQTASAAQSTAETAASEGTSSIVSIGQEIEAGGWRFKVTEVHKRKAVYLYDESYIAMGHFLIVILEATNLQSGTDYFARNIEPWLTDDPGNVYTLSGTGSGYARWQYGGLTSIYTDVNPGNFARIAIAYDLPDSTGHVLLSTDVSKWVDLGNFNAMVSEDN